MRVFPCKCCLELRTAIKRACLKVKETLSLMIGGETDTGRDNQLEVNGAKNSRKLFGFALHISVRLLAQFVP